MHTEQSAAGAIVVDVDVDPDADALDWVVMVLLEKDDSPSCLARTPRGANWAANGVATAGAAALLYRAAAMISMHSLVSFPFRQNWSSAAAKQQKRGRKHNTRSEIEEGRQTFQVQKREESDSKGPDAFLFAPPPAGRAG
jgi:hypothetical protein